MYDDVYLHLLCHALNIRQPFPFPPLWVNEVSGLSHTLPGLDLYKSWLLIFSSSLFLCINWSQFSLCLPPASLPLLKINLCRKLFGYDTLLTQSRQLGGKREDRGNGRNMSLNKRHTQLSTFIHDCGLWVTEPGCRKMRETRKDGRWLNPTKDSRTEIEQERPRNGVNAHWAALD